MGGAGAEPEAGGEEGSQDPAAATHAGAAESADDPAAAAHAARLRDRLINGSIRDRQTDIVSVINGRTTLASRFDPVDLGHIDARAGYPDSAPDVTPNAVVAFRSDEQERAAAIEDLIIALDSDLETEVERRRIELELTELRLKEATYRLVERHPRGAKAGFFEDGAAAQRAIDGARADAEAAEPAEAEKPDAEAAEPAEAEKPDAGQLAAETPDTGNADDQAGHEHLDGGMEGSIAPPGGERRLTDLIRPTADQRATASEELVWSIDGRWFWWGSAALFLAELPFLHAVVGELLLERDPWFGLQALATLSVTVGFLIGTKLTGLLLRRAQSMFLLASLIQPGRPPSLRRFGAWLLGRSLPAAPSDPTEEHLRFMAWTRLVGALLLAGLLFAAVLSIASYRSEAAESLALRESIGDRISDTPTADEDDRDDAPPEVDHATLQQVFQAIALLNVVGAIALAWASTSVPYDEVPAESDDDLDPYDDWERGTTEAPGGDGQAASNRERRNQRRRDLAKHLEDELEQRRAELSDAKAALVDAQAKRSRLGHRAETLQRLSDAQSRLDEHTYWLANRANRSFVVSPDVDRALAANRDAHPDPSQNGGVQDG